MTGFGYNMLGFGSAVGAQPPSAVTYLVIGGGGGGSESGAGGGGAGGYRTASSFSVSAGSELTVTIGGGGAAATASSGSGTFGSAGSSSVFSSITLGGGGTGGSGGSRYLQRVAQFSMSLNKLIGNKKLFDNNYRRDRMIEPAQYDDNNNRLRKKSTGWKFGSLNALRNHWERRNGLDRWTGQKVLTESTQGIIEELSLGDNNTTSEIEVKRKKKLVGDITSLIVD